MKLLKKIKWNLFPKKKELIETLQSTWDQFGKEDTFFSVVTDEKYKDENLSSEIIDDFYSLANSRDCVEYVNAKLKTYKNFSLADCKDKKGLEFGCGVGRNLVHLAPYFKDMLGIDISEKHLEQAKKICQKMNISQARVQKSYDYIEDIGQFDFIFTVITLQHIPPPLMKAYIQQLLNMLLPGGIALFQLPVAREKGYKYNEEKCIQKESPLSWQMHILPEKIVNKIIKQCGCKLLEFDTSVDHCGPDWKNGFFIVEKP